MSHKASSWLASIPAQTLNASAFRVLFHLCDAHNSMRPADEACFPQQSFLLVATGLSNGGLNNALNAIEGAGLMRRVRSSDGDGRRRTFFVLGCDFDPKQDQTPKNGASTKLQSGGDQTPIWREPNSNSVEFDKKAEPVKEPVKEPVRREEGIFPDLPKQGSEPEKDHFAEFWEAYPKCQRKTDRAKAMAIFRQITDGKHKAIPKTDPMAIIAGIKAYAAKGPDPQFIPLPTTWLNGERWGAFSEADTEIDPERARLREIIARAQAAARPMLPRE